MRLLTAIVLIFSLIFTVDTSVARDLTSLEKYRVNIINKTRTKYDLQPVQVDERLTAAADKETKYIIQKDRFIHWRLKQRIIESSFPATQWGENIAWVDRKQTTSRKKVRIISKMLFNSKVHRNNILNPNFTHVGVSIRKGKYTCKKSVYKQDCIYGKTYNALVLTEDYAK